MHEEIKCLSRQKKKKKKNRWASSWNYFVFQWLRPDSWDRDIGSISIFTFLMLFNSGITSNNIHMLGYGRSPLNPTSNSKMHIQFRHFSLPATTAVVFVIIIFLQLHRITWTMKGILATVFDSLLHTQTHTSDQLKGKVIEALWHFWFRFLVLKLELDTG